MKKIAALLIFSFFASIFQVKADEGMWLPIFIKRLNYADMQKKGLKLTPEEIYSVNSSSLKDAIVSLGGFCTGEMISDQGLMLTNHHCGYDAIQQFSSVKNDYLTDGFWAKEKSQELNVPGLTVTFLVKMVDVTQDVLGTVTDEMTVEQKAEAINKVKKELIENAIKETHYTAYVKEFFYGNEYYMFVNETYSDVRLVGAPPESVGKYGGNTDNWMWPRHTGDFALFRVYCGEDGKPAEHSESNIPFKPRHHLPVSIKGIEEGDFAMVMGYPGSTDRYLSSFGVKQAIEKHGPTVVEIRDLKLKTMKVDMDADKDVRIKYASKHAQTSNYWKYYIGQTEQLQTNNVFDRKLELENQFKAWIAQDKSREEKYGKALTYIEDYYKMTDKYKVGDVYALEAGLTGSEVFLYTYRVNGALRGLSSVTEKFNKKIEEEKDQQKIAELKEELAKTRAAIIAKLKEQTTAHFKDYNMSTDKKLVANLLDLYYTKVDKDQHPNFFGDVKKGDFDKYADKLFSKSPFVSEKKMNKIFAKLEKGKEVKKLKDDKAVIASNDLITMYFGSSARYEEAEQNMEEGYRLFVEGIRLMEPDKSFYPNANSTQRLTYGSVGSYKMSDNVIKDLRSQDGVGSFYTTIDGLIEKEDATNPEFVIPAKLKELYKAKDYGQYADKKTGNLHINFLSNNDITGGNSGSPVINGDGHLIGTAFDGNWEAMSGDISFENKVQRTISVDIRYTLFIIDKFAGASHLIDEMTIVR